MLHDDIIIRAAIVSIVKCEIDLYNSTLACSERNLLSEYCQVSSRWPAMVFHDAQSSLREFTRNLSNASLIMKIDR